MPTLGRKALGGPYDAGSVEKLTKWELLMVRTGRASRRNRLLGHLLNEERRQTEILDYIARTLAARQEPPRP